MGYLQQASSGLADASQLTISTWFNIADEGVAFVKLFSWGTGDVNSDSYFGVYPTPGPLAGGGELKIVGRDNSIVVSGSDPYSFGTYDPGSGSSAAGFTPPSIFSAIGNADFSNVFDCEQWYHIMLAFDVSTGAALTYNKLTVHNGIDYTSTTNFHYTAKCVVNAVNVGMDVGGTLYYPEIYDGSLSFQPEIVPKAWHSSTQSDNWSDTLPPFPMKVLGTTAQMIGQTTSPYVFGGGSITPKVRRGPTFVYVNRFIDPTDPDNYAKFVNLSGGYGTPQPASVAIAAFGASDVEFNGSRDDFVANQGSGADVFSLVGTASAYTATRPRFAL